MVEEDVETAMVDGRAWRAEKGTRAMQERRDAKRASLPLTPAPALSLACARAVCLSLYSTLHGRQDANGTISHVDLHAQTS